MDIKLAGLMFSGVNHSRVTMKRILFAFLIAIPVQASAVLVSSSVGDYEVTTVEGTFENLSSTLMAQVWWWDGAFGAPERADLAIEFSDLVGVSLGFPTTTPIGPAGPLFAYTIDTFPWVNTAQWSQNLDQTGGFAPLQDTVQTFAVATRITVPEPSTLSLICVTLLGLGMQRKRGN